MRVLIATVLMAAAAGAALLTGAGPADAQAETSLYVSGFHAGRGNRPILRLANTSPDFADQFQVRVFVRAPDNGALLNPSDPPRELFAGRTLEIDLNGIVAAVNPNYKGPIQVVCFGTGGFFRSFGPGTIVAEAVQQEGKATYAAVTRWQQ